MLGYNNRLFVTNGWKVINPHNIAKVFWRPSWIIHFPPMGFFWTFTMSFCIIFFISSEKMSLLRIYLMFSI